MEKSLENPNSLSQRIDLAFENPDPKVMEKFKDRELWVQQQASERVHLIPPQGDKHIMLALNTIDLELYDLFNQAASQVIRKWDGFHQIGADNKDGLTAWEIWKKPDISDDELLIKVKKKMLEITAEVMGP